MAAALVLLPSAALAGEGGSLYALHCSSCHGQNGQGSNVAPALIDKPAVLVHFMLDTGRMPAPAPHVNEIHKTAAFTDPQIDAIVNYVESFSRHPDRSMPLIMPGNAVRGHALFAENCAVCHGATGAGASVGAQDVAPSLGNATVFEVAEAIRAGPGVMPRFGPDLLSDQDVSDIARYVNEEQTQESGRYGENAGGFSLAHVGPVAEGLVAWIFGIGGLVLFVRLVGETE